MSSSFFQLHNNNYDTGKALQELVKNPVPLSTDKKWSEDETVNKNLRELKNQNASNFYVRKNLYAV